MRSSQMASGGLVGRAILALVVITVAVGVSASAGSGQSLATKGSPLVGEWQRVATCSQLVADLKLAGLGKTVAQAWVGQTSSRGQSSFSPVAQNQRALTPAGAQSRDGTRISSPLPGSSARWTGWAARWITRPTASSTATP